MRRWLIICVFGLVAAACGGSSSGTNNSVSSNSGSAGTTSGSSGGQTLSFKETEYSITPATVTTKAGKYTIDVSNVGQFPHDLHIATSDGSELGSTPVIKAGQTGSFTVTLPAGTYTIWCAVDAHRSLGMQASLTAQ